jgi:iron complex transport system ATP-binding protein
VSFVAQGVTVQYDGATGPALRDASLEFGSGVHTAVLGPNGAGKSTLLRVLLGLISPTSGEVRFDGRPTVEWTRREMARRAALVAAGEEFAFPLSVRELVAMGRTTHLGPWRAERPVDREVVRQSLHDVDLLDLAERPVATLSAGELQRARLARALAQESDHLLLDEPTAHLDLGHELATFQRIQQLTRTKNLTTISVTHNLNLASRFADRVVLLSRGQVTAVGLPREVLVADRIEEAFGCPVEVRDLGELGVLAVPMSRPVPQ